MDIKTIESHLHSGKNVKVSLTMAKVISSKKKLIAISHYKSVYVNCIVVSDEKYGNIYLSSSSPKVFDAQFGDLVSGKILLTGIGEKNERYDAPIKFSKVIRGKEGEISLQKGLTVNN